MPRSKAASGMRRQAAWGSVGWKVMIHLLEHRPTVASARELARDLRLGHSQVAAVLGFLTFHRALVEGKAGLSVEWEQLARLMGALRLPDIFPARTFDAALSQQGFREEAEARGLDFAFGFTTAANVLAYFEPHPEVCVLVERADVDEAVSIFRNAEIGMVEPRRAVDKRNAPRFLVFTDKLRRLDLTQSRHGPITSLHQTYIDLLHFPLAAAHADFLRKAIEARWQREQEEAGADTARRGE